MGTCLGDVSPFTGPRAYPRKKLIITFANSLDLDKARHKKVGLDLHLNSVRSDVDPLMMFLGEFFQNVFMQTVWTRSSQT